MWLQLADEFLATVFGGPRVHTIPWYEDFKIYLSIAMYVIFWLLALKGHNSNYWTRWLEIVSMDLMMLHMMQHYDSELGKMVALTVVGAHFGGTCIWDYFHKAYEVHSQKKFTAHNVYQDLGNSWSKTATVFLGQLFLVYLYTHCILQTDIDFTQVSYTYWLGSIVAIQMASMFGRGGDSQLGYAYHTKLWSYLLKKVTRISMGDDDQSVLDISKANLYSRSLMSFFVNQVMRCLVGASMPLILMQSKEPMDFLQNSLAVAFIFQLDDTSSGGTYILQCESSNAELEEGQSSLLPQNSAKRE